MQLQELGFDYWFLDKEKKLQRPDCKVARVIEVNRDKIGCSLLASVENGELCEDRFRNYLKLLGESEYYNMSYVEKRRKDRKFGQFIKSAMKQIKKN
ncbi:MAG: hypothetical protein HQM09_14150 [Candidatus Riflebacteria bacterium]|nr:hypothetical protein [Candidatus Riflebacteria bacterium]